MAQNQTGDSPLTLLHKSFDAGITFFDTADMYTQGGSETLVGQAFHARRDKVVIASKGGYCLPSHRKLFAGFKPLLRPLVRALGIKRGNLPAAVSGTFSQDFSPDYLNRAVEASLRRLKTDYLDLYQLHSPPAATIAGGEYIEVLEKLKTQGKIRYYGVAVDAIEEAMQCLRFAEISSVMIPFGLLDQDAFDGFLVQADKRKLAVIARGCFGAGLLSPDLTPQQLETKTDKWQRILTYRQLAEQQGRSLLEMALQFSLRVRPISVNLLGMRSESHLRTNLDCLAAPPLSDAQMQAFAVGRDLQRLGDLTSNSPTLS